MKRKASFIYQSVETSFGFSADFWISSRSWSSFLPFISIPSFSAVSCILLFEAVGYFPLTGLVLEVYLPQKEAELLRKSLQVLVCLS
jgi:hypothetical protein